MMRSARATRNPTVAASSGASSALMAPKASAGGQEKSPAAKTPRPEAQAARAAYDRDHPGYGVASVEAPTTGRDPRRVQEAQAGPQPHEAPPPHFEEAAPEPEVIQNKALPLDKCHFVLHDGHDTLGRGDRYDRLDSHGGSHERHGRLERPHTIDPNVTIITIDTIYARHDTRWTG
ncbi:unnamed protein product [Phytophthora fragariaefolia]|uniref:Unnamed protein product n=1 Tax=Phytophthora fragariaefolia TaxID=1490495 RepID=A0A9W6YA61_9STRA|nr:unnamed protein product [Phytophthora fragariaefolia]